MNDNYTFYQMPKFLFSGRFNISSQAKILYSLLLDRQRLSVKTTPHTPTKRAGYTFSSAVRVQPKCCRVTETLSQLI